MKVCCCAIFLFLSLLSRVAGTSSWAERPCNRCDTLLTSVNITVTPELLSLICRDANSPTLMVKCGQSFRYERLEQICQIGHPSLHRSTWNQSLSERTVVIRLIGTENVLQLAQIEIQQFMTLAYFRICVQGPGSSRISLGIRRQCPEGADCNWADWQPTTPTNLSQQPTTPNNLRLLEDGDSCFWIPPGAGPGSEDAFLDRVGSTQSSAVGDDLRPILNKSRVKESVTTGQRPTHDDKTQALFSDSADTNGTQAVMLASTPHSEATTRGTGQVTGQGARPTGNFDSLQGVDPQILGHLRQVPLMLPDDGNIKETHTHNFSSQFLTSTRRIDVDNTYWIHDDLENNLVRILKRDIQDEDNMSRTDIQEISDTKSIFQLHTESILDLKMSGLFIPTANTLFVYSTSTDSITVDSQEILKENLVRSVIAEDTFVENILKINLITENIILPSTETAFDTTEAASLTTIYRSIVTRSTDNPIEEQDQLYLSQSLPSLVVPSSDMLTHPPSSLTVPRTTSSDGQTSADVLQQSLSYDMFIRPSLSIQTSISSQTSPGLDILTPPSRTESFLNPAIISPSSGATYIRTSSLDTPETVVTLTAAAVLLSPTPTADRNLITSMNYAQQSSISKLPSIASSSKEPSFSMMISPSSHSSFISTPSSDGLPVTTTESSMTSPDDFSVTSSSPVILPGTEVSSPGSGASSGLDDSTFWPLVAALVIGIPLVVVLVIAITVICRNRKQDPSKFFDLKTINNSSQTSIATQVDTVRQTSVDV